MSHHGETAGPICPKFCTQIQGSIDGFCVFFILFFFVLELALYDLDLKKVIFLYFWEWRLLGMGLGE